MSFARPFAFNTGSTISGTIQVGNLAVGYPTSGFDATGLQWWNGPDEELGYVIAQPVPDNSQPTPVFGQTASVGFFRTSGFNDNEFVDIANTLLNSNYNNSVEASSALTSNGYWNSYISPVLYLDAGNPLSYPGTGSVWTDLIGGKIFNLFNGPNYGGGFGGFLDFQTSLSQYAQCNTSLQSLPEFTISVWHNWNGNNTGEFPCIITEVYVGGAINYVLGNPQGAIAQGGYFNGGFQLSPQFILTPNTWYNIVVTCDASQVVKIYLNNTLISTTSTTGGQPSSSNAGIRLMRRWDFAENWGGFLSIVGIYDKSLDSQQISSLWNANKSRFGL
jgi:hypothetical protein